MWKPGVPGLATAGGDPICARNGDEAAGTLPVAGDAEATGEPVGRAPTPEFALLSCPSRNYTEKIKFGPCILELSEVNV